ncbi:alkyl hydroperoxide reductase [Elizabethkingia anophelis]|nr:alkyl hydroperoxide reductase [Elizabethkingia anophelis]
MSFPHFAGKTYDFILFQGDHQKTVVQGTIPQDGNFTLSIPQEYAPYTGMSRWLITGTQEGGGLNMYIPGRDFSVSCKEAVPTEKNIIYTHNTANTELNDLYRKQESIFMRYEAMLMASKVFVDNDKNYPVFLQELEKQKNAYRTFHHQLRKKSDYMSQFIPIVNITRGMGTILSNNEEEKALNISQYIVNELNWDKLYTSGHWTSVIDAWVSIHTQVLKDQKQFAIDFSTLTSKIKNPLYIDFAGRVAYYLTQQEKKEYILSIAPIVKASGKITTYEGSLMAFSKENHDSHQ